MKDLISILKRWILWIIISYLFIISLFFVALFIPQKNQIIKYKTEKNLLEYNYLKIKNNPNFFKSIEKMVEMAENKVYDFEWLNYSDDPNLTIYEYLEELSKKTGMEIISVKNSDKKNDLYYLWEVELSGNFKNFIYFINTIETEKRYLKIEEIEILSSDKENDFFKLKIAGIKKVK